MFCPRCGKELKNNQRFCINCGYDLSEELSAVKNNQDDLELILYYFIELIIFLCYDIPNIKIYEKLIFYLINLIFHYIIRMVCI